MRKYIVTILIIFLAHSAFAGPVQELMVLAESAFSEGDYLKAKGYYVDIINLQSATDDQRDYARYNINVCQNHINEAQYYSGYNHALSLFKDKNFTQSRNYCYGLLKYRKHKTATNKLIQQCNDSINARVTAQQVTDSIQQLNQLREEYNSIVEEAFTYYNNKQYLNALMTLKETEVSKYNSLGETEPAWVDICRNIYQAQQRGEAVTPELAITLQNVIDIKNFNSGVARIRTRYVQGDYSTDSTRFINVFGKDIFALKGTAGKLNYEYREGLLRYKSYEMIRAWGYYDTKGKFIGADEIVGPNYFGPLNERYICDVMPYSNGMAAFYLEDKKDCRKYDKIGYLNKNFKVVIPPQYDCATDFREGYALVRKGKKWFFIDTNGKQLKLTVPINIVGGFRTAIGHYEKIQTAYFNDGLAGFKTDNGEFVFINNKGEIVLSLDEEISNKIIFNSPELHGYLPFSNGLIPVKDNNGFGFMDKSGTIITPLVYESTYGFKDGLAPVLIDQKWGFINTNGELVISPKFEDVSHRGFCEDYCAVKIDGKWGFIDNHGILKIPAIYECPFNVMNGAVGDFSNGFAAVALKGQLGYVDKFGNSTFDFK